MTVRLLSLSAVAAGVLALSAVSAQAQQAPQHGVATMRLAVSPEQVQQIVSDRLLQDGVTAGLATLRQNLSLTPAQQSRWRDFILASNAKPSGFVLAVVAPEDETPLAQARAGLVLQREQLAFEARRVKTMARLYKSLDDNQRAVFDQAYSVIGSLSVSTQATAGFAQAAGAGVE
ncbi:Spy/CpxP family protein refolding chaperone [Caulobacter hibisci]|uniref:Spy/CpxP family protein refolding chaperone n=1 Tax=Caulobacter hibisci TaxID=2035993 RepID=A0ABS0SU29_9CAUL|nr:Spy/CpxP family protein refolding chaperone [Caulobacter hibisci]MBI1683096.1 Spy/CpxP family protein refolding chaperone [Caulobacter hibisci]